MGGKALHGQAQATNYPLRTGRAKKLHSNRDRFSKSKPTAISHFFFNRLAVHYLGALNPTGGVSGIHHQLRFLDDVPEIVVGVIGHD